MIRLRPLRPREVRSIRHWAIELAVVVVGVMIALWASEWVATQNERAELARVEADMIEELKGNVFASEIHATMRPCFIARIEEMRDMLIDSDGDWPGLESGAVYATNRTPLRFPSVFSYSNARPGSRFWQEAEEAGLSRLMDPDRRVLLGQAYLISQRAAQNMDDILAQRGELSGLVYAGTLTPEMRHEALGALREIDSSLFVLEAIHPDLIEKVRALGIRSDEVWENYAADHQDLQAEVGDYAPCVRAFTNPLATGENE